jgi:hypothetical protein
VAEALKYFNNVVKKKAIVFLISDFINPVPETAKANEFKNSLNIVGKKHDLIGLHVYDEREAHIPDIGLAKVYDSESGNEFWIDTSDKTVRDNYAKSFRDNVNMVKDLFGKGGGQMESIKTEDNYVIALMNMFKKREMRR